MRPFKKLMSVSLTSGNLSSASKLARNVSNAAAYRWNGRENHNVSQFVYATNIYVYVKRSNKWENPT